MWTHVSDAALMDVVDGTAEARVVAHVGGCDRCRARVEEARGGMVWAERTSVPEPVPAYWEVLRRQVARRIVESPTAPSRRPLWAAATAVAGAVLAAVLVSRPPVPAPHPAASPSLASLPAWSALPPAEEDSALPLLEEAAPTAAAFAPALECADLAECVITLSDEESGELADRLRRQIHPPTRGWAQVPSGSTL